MKAHQLVGWDDELKKVFRFKKKKNHSAPKGKEIQIFFYTTVRENFWNLNKFKTKNLHACDIVDDAGLLFNVSSWWCCWRKYDILKQTKNVKKKLSHLKYNNSTKKSSPSSKSLFLYLCSNNVDRISAVLTNDRAHFKSAETWATSNEIWKDRSDRCCAYRGQKKICKIVINFLKLDFFFTWFSKCIDDQFLTCDVKFSL